MNSDLVGSLGQKHVLPGRGNFSERRPRDSCHDGLFSASAANPATRLSCSLTAPLHFVMVLTVGELDSSETEVATKDRVPWSRLSSNSNHRIIQLKYLR